MEFWRRLPQVVLSPIPVTKVSINLNAGVKLSAILFAGVRRENICTAEVYARHFRMEIRGDSAVYFLILVRITHVRSA